jgi:ferredoxin
MHFCDNSISKRKVYCSVHLSKVVQTEKKSLMSTNRCMAKHEISCKKCAEVCTDSTAITGKTAEVEAHNRDEAVSLQ